MEERQEASQAAEAESSSTSRSGGPSSAIASTPSNDAIDFAAIAVRGNRRMTVNDLELLDRTAREIGAKSIVETGSMDGCSSMVLGRVARDTGGRLICIEPAPKGKWKQNMLDLGLNDHVIMIVAASPWLDYTMLSRPIDFLLIDGDHRCSRAITDYVALGRFVRKGGRIAFHDIDGGKGVALYVREAVKICERDDNLNSPQGADYKIRQIARTPAARDRGTIVFEKDAEPW